KHQLSQPAQFPYPLPYTLRGKVHMPQAEKHQAQECAPPGDHSETRCQRPAEGKRDSLSPTSDVGVREVREIGGHVKACSPSNRRRICSQVTSIRATMMMSINTNALMST